MRVRFVDSTTDLGPFVRVTAIWGLLSGIATAAVSGDPASALRPWAALFCLSVADLYFLVKTIASTLHLMSDQGAEKRSAYAIQAFTYGGMKLLCLGAIGFYLAKSSDAPVSGILFGLGSLVVIPLAGGFWWSQTQLGKADSGT